MLPGTVLSYAFALPFSLLPSQARSKMGELVELFEQFVDIECEAQYGGVTVTEVFDLLFELQLQRANKSDVFTTIYNRTYLHPLVHRPHPLSEAIFTCQWTRGGVCLIF